MPKPKSRSKIKTETVNHMQELGTYREQYEQIIDVYVDMLYQYQCMSAQFEAEGFNSSVETERSGGKKNPVLVCLENLRKDIGSYSDRLKLNAKAYETETIPDKKEKSVFAKLLDENRQDDAS